MTTKNLKSIPGFSGYSVDRLGNIYSSKRNQQTKMNPYVTINGYNKVSLKSDDGIVKHFQLHRLIAQCFIKNPKNLPIVNHKNGKKTDNRVVNLEWTDAKGNARHYQKYLKPKTKKIRKNIEKENQDYLNKHYENMADVMDKLMRVYGEDNPRLVCKIYKVIAGIDY
jgi:hypothetical protein